MSLFCNVWALQAKICGHKVILHPQTNSAKSQRHISSQGSAGCVFRGTICNLGGGYLTRNKLNRATYAYTLHHNSRLVLC
jgi:hypothetical protein